MARCWMYQCPPNSQRPSHLHEPPNVLQRSIWRSSKSFSLSLASNIESSINGLPSRQLSGYCLSQLEALEAPPTTSPTTNDRTVDYWYPGEGVQTESWANDLAGLTYIARSSDPPDYDSAWSQAGCLNSLPLPFSPGDRPTYYQRGLRKFVI